MLMVLSPAKSLDYESPLPVGVNRRATQPDYMDDAADLIATLRPLGPAQIAELMDLSDSLAALNVGRYGAWEPQCTPRNSRPAILAFNGDVYDGLQASTLDPEGLKFAQDHVLILSGLYGLLRPLDRLQPYRLEMGTRLPNSRGKDLYAFWGDRLAQAVQARLESWGPRSRSGEPVLVNLASQEYFKAVDRPALRARVVECVFEDAKGGDWKVISFFAKRARGLMARYAINHRITRVEGLKDFAEAGYRYAPQVSSTDRWVFRRNQASE